jgi:uncharacterized membrane protein
MATSRAAVPEPSDAPARAARLDSVDLLRGLVMVIMALDHTRDFFSSVRFPPTDPGQTYAALFFTRWVTHFCAPVFSLLAGTGVYLASRRSRPSQIAGFLWKRGVWLIVLEWTIVWFAWTFIPMPMPVMLVIWALGASMVALSLLIRLPPRWVGALGVLMIAGHNLADGIQAASLGRFRLAWMILHEPGFYPLSAQGRFGIFVLYPLVPWIGVMAAGYALGEVFAMSSGRRRRMLLVLGAGMCALFVILRLTNLYGNPVAGFSAAAGLFAAQPTAGKTIIAFLNVEKYPPSLQYLLMTLGPAVLALAWFERFTFASAPGRLARRILVFGRVPLFYYVLHLFLIHSLAVLVGAAARMPIGWLFHGGFAFGQMPPEFGFGLPFVYLMWGVAIVMLYLPCRWFAGLKQRRRDVWLSYL